jgi:Predicted pyrophosphatase
MSDTFIANLQRAQREFARERDWEQFHTPKNLAMALTVEAAELQEIFQWLRPDEASALSPEQTQHLREELADVLLYLCRLADVCNVDLESAAWDKLRRNAEKYPADLVRGSARRPIADTKQPKD